MFEAKKSYRIKEPTKEGENDWITMLSCAERDVKLECSKSVTKPAVLRIDVSTKTAYFCSFMNISDDLQTRWWNLEAKLLERFGKKPDMEAVLFLIGLQETGFVRSKITKEQKQDLMHVAVCTLLSESGYYLCEGKDEEGWPHFRQLKEIPAFQYTEQENFLKDHILLYFEKHDF